MEKRILKLDDLIKLSKILTDNGFDSADMEIIINISTSTLLNKINEDLYLRNNTSNKDAIVENVDEINLCLNNINFKYVLKDGAK